MNRPPKKTPKKRPNSNRSGQSPQPKLGPTGREKVGQPANEKADNRDPAVIRAEIFRVAAFRETAEAFVVAFILALLFRAFLAEAFVIPTGSMAPTLMGAHKDIVCPRCDAPYQCGASSERRGPVTEVAVVATICPNCRHTNALDLINKSNDATFNGDRILVSKFTYTLAEPERWDVIVFKYPGNPKQNYIKRLVGLPNETLTIRHGDVYARKTGSPSTTSKILRKAPSTLLAMRHLVFDTQHQSLALIKAGYPSRWQPWTENASAPPTDSWKIGRDENGLTATVDTSDSDERHWLRYYHRWADADQWDRADEGLILSDVDPYSSRLITDFYSYNAYINVAANYLYQQGNEPASFRGSFLERMFHGGYSKGEFLPSYQPGESPAQFGSASVGNHDSARTGMHWVGDLILEADVETSSECSELIVELVEAGIKYRCQFDLATGTASLSIDDGEPLSFESAGSESNQRPTAPTSLRAGQRHQVRLSNCDDQLLLWVDGKVIQFATPTTFDARQFRSVDKNHPQYLASHPLDAAPAAIAVVGGTNTIHQLRVDRDKYYIAVDRSSYSGLNDYDPSIMRQLVGSGVSNQQIQEALTMRDQWADFVGWQTRRIVEFELQEDQFFPMGDNSPESQDARCWAGTNPRDILPGEVNEKAYRWTNASYVPRDLLVGKALVVFWPHSWNAPVPFIPNVNRMKLIR